MVVAVNEQFFIFFSRNAMRTRAPRKKFG